MATATPKMPVVLMFKARAYPAYNWWLAAIQATSYVAATFAPRQSLSDQKERQSLWAG
jgi:hypothetical protein